MTHRRIILAAALALVAVGVTACGGSSAPGPQRADTVTHGGSTRSASPTGASAVAQLRAALITVDVLPTGWAVSKSLESGRDSTHTFCNRRVPKAHYVRAQTGFEKAASGPFVGEVLRQFTDAAAAASSLQSAERAAESCSSFGHGKTRTKINPVSFPRLGDRTFAVQLTLGQGRFDDVFVQRGATLLQIDCGGLGSAHSALAQRVTTQALAKLDEAIPES